MDSFEGKTAVITGAASGIGLAMAHRFAREGANVVMSDLSPEPLEAAVEAVAQTGGTAIGFVADASKADEVEALAARADEVYGRTHILCNNAGVAMGGVLWENSLADWDWVLGVNLYGVVHGIRSFVPRMLEHGERSAIVNTASFSGLSSQPAMGIYGVSKHGVLTMTETLFYELEAVKANIQAHALCPGWIQTGINQSDRTAPDGVSSMPDEASPLARTVSAYVSQAVEEGKPPELVADMVADGIKANRFYIITHPEWLGMVKVRMTDILQQQNPSWRSPITG